MLNASVRRPIALQISIGYVICSIVLIALAGGVTYSLFALFAVVDQVERAQMRIDAYGDVLQAATDAETGQRGYIITGQDRYLEPYLGARQRSREQIVRLTILSPTDMDLGVLQNLTEAKFSELERTIGQRKTMGFATAAASVETDEGQRLMVSIRTSVANLTHTETANLARLRHEASELARNSAIAAGVGLALALTSLGIGGITVVRNITNRVSAMADAARAIGEGQLGRRVEHQGRDEIDALASDLNRMADRIQESNEALDSFSYTVSHDLRAPLRAMHGFSQALLEDYGAALDDTGRRYAERIVIASERMDALIQDLLAYSRLSRTDMDALPVSLDALMVDTLAEMQPEIAASRGSIDVAPQLGSVLCHERTLQQILVNLLSNALKFVVPGETPHVRVWTDQQGSELRLWVEDDGIGIAAEHRQRIFKVFERLHGSETYPGTGIGLAIVKKGIERMNGSVGIADKPDGGCRFWIKLPGGGTP